MAEVTNLNIKIDRSLKAEADKIYRGAENAKPKVNIEQRHVAMQEIRELLADVDGNSINLDQIKAERRAAKFECND